MKIKFGILIALLGIPSLAYSAQTNCFQWDADIRAKRNLVGFLQQDIVDVQNKMMAYGAWQTQIENYEAVIAAADEEIDRLNNTPVTTPMGADMIRQGIDNQNLIKDQANSQIAAIKALMRADSGYTMEDLQDMLDKLNERVAKIEQEIVDLRDKKLKCAMAVAD